MRVFMPKKTKRAVAIICTKNLIRIDNSRQSSTTPNTSIMLDERTIPATSFDMNRKRKKLDKETKIKDKPKPIPPMTGIPLGTSNP